MKRYDIGLALCVVLLTVAPLGVKAQRASVSAAEVTGTFRMNFTGHFRASYDEIQIASIGKGKIRVFMDLLYPYKMRNGDDMANIGQLDHDFSIAGDTATYTSGECTMTIKFVRPGTIKVTQKGNDADCGFGHNVFADGTYRKVSSKKPSFDTEHE